ncbi:MAG: O-antigen polymerase, partial [Verrucomicrobiales bacterium]|nr:O-antigen polymerase [Verrucomicrobiales bacterium]
FWLAVTLTKFGNPIIFEGQVAAPTTFWEFVLASWPLSWGYLFLSLLGLLALLAFEKTFSVPKWILALLLLWIGWVFFSSAQTVSKPLTTATLGHLIACVGCFFVGLIALNRLPRLTAVWIGLFLGMLLIFWFGWDQHFGGLEQTRKEFLSIDWTQYTPEARATLDTPEFRKKILSDRIFSTFVYPNALAGGILLFLPLCLRAIWELFRRLQLASRLLIMTLVGVLALGCLYWSGSKAGWLLCLGSAAMAFLMTGLSRKIKVAGLTLLLAAGVCGFFVKYSTYLSKGATSASARMDYWKAAWEVARSKPILGSGPGTFSIEYKQRKSPEAEMARLTHNDYLEQFSDSGWIAGLAFAGFIWGSVILLYRDRLFTWREKALWLGVAGFAAQSVVEFGLYIPSLSWPFFLFLGWLWGAKPPEAKPAAGARALKAVDKRQQRP